MSHRGESSSATTPIQRQEQGGSSVRGHGGRGVPYPLGDGTGLPLVMCPDCGMARVIELRVVQETPNKGQSFFKCPRNGTPKLCGFYRFPKQYLDELIGLGVVVTKAQELCEDKEACIGSVEDEQRKDLEKKMANLTLKMNYLLVLFVVFLIVMVVISIAKAAGPFAI